MADYNGNIYAADFINGFGTSSPGTIMGLRSHIIQRIWDTTAGWCQYAKNEYDPTPLVTETTPNHTNNLVASTHHKIGELR